MKNKPDSIETVLDRSISGFHQYLLTDTPRLRFVSGNLCTMLGLSEDELLDGSEDMYALAVHDADREGYLDFINGLGCREGSFSLEYRLVKKDGSVIYVRDTVTVRRLENGSVLGDSVLADITDFRDKNSDLQFLNDTVPCGFIRYTCEKQPRITYMNDRMRELLRIPAVSDGGFDWLGMCSDNIFLLIPMEDRQRFAAYLDRVLSSSSPLVGEMTVLRCDGSRANLLGWVTKCTNADGTEEFQSVCMDVTERQREKEALETKRYIAALSEIYDKIFEYDLKNDTVNCLYSNNSPIFRNIENIPMRMEEATEKWIAGRVVAGDIDRVRAFFSDFRQKKLYGEENKPPQITYRAQASDGDERIYSGIFLKIDSYVSLYCCRCVPDSASADSLQAAYDSLRENMRGLIMHFTDGIAAFEVKDQYVTPLYASDNVCEFFGYAREEWMYSMKNRTPIREFVSRSDASYEAFEKLLRIGEAEFTYFDLESETTRRIRAVCSEKSLDPSLPRYVMLYNVEGDTHSDAESVSAPAVKIRTFGYFDVFVDERPIAFRNKKAKELFALLVDRRGGFVSSEEAISFLWEDETVNSLTLARYRKVALRLKNTLEEYGIADAMESVDGKRRIVTERVDCDLYNYLSGAQEYASLFKGSYLTNYSWGENTLAQLTGDILP